MLLWKEEMENFIISVLFPKEPLNRPRLCRQHKKPRVQDYTVLAGVAQCQRRHSCFRLDALVVVKVDVTVNHLIGF